jgi:hypothetical protein
MPPKRAAPSSTEEETATESNAKRSHAAPRLEEVCVLIMFVKRMLEKPLKTLCTIHIPLQNNKKRGCSSNF